MIKTIQTPINTNEIFFDKIRNTKNSIRLCSPFVKSTVVDEILENKIETSKITLITSNSLANFKANVCDLDALEKLIREDYKVYYYKDIHSKIYVFDNDDAIVTSANLTHSGLNRNHEYGLHISNEEITKEISTDYNKMIESKFSAEFTLEIIKDLQEQLNSISLDDVSIEIKDGEYFLPIKNVYTILNGMKKDSWKKIVLSKILEINKQEFKREDVLKYLPEFKEKYPNNKTPGQKVSQQLQFIRDLGLIEFVSPGVYKKLWI